MISCSDAVCIGLSFRLQPDQRPEDVGIVIHTARIAILGTLWGEFVEWRVMPDGESNVALVEFFPELAGDGWPVERVAEFIDEIEVAMAVDGLEFTRLYDDE